MFDYYGIKLDVAQPNISTVFDLLLHVSAQGTKTFVCGKMMGVGLLE